MDFGELIWIKRICDIWRESRDVTGIRSNALNLKRDFIAP